ncbi:MAG TPA: hypoxanthine phosphoribosyltransferase [Bacteroidales bacterium]|nr:hypoxanthine phosphoribosyltransferase [Bacteroidales bacterium]
MIKVKDKEFQISIPAVKINLIVQELANQINRDYEGKNPIFLSILNGSFIFAADLIRKITIPCEISFVKFSSYSGTSSTENVKELIGLSEDVGGRHVIIIEDIVDTGITMELLLEDVKKLNPASVKLACFTFKPEAFRKTFRIDYLGISIPNDFIVGYGLDYDGYGRNLPDIYKVSEA